MDYRKAGKVGPGTEAVGLDTVYRITDYWAKTTNDLKLKGNAAYLIEFVEQGLLGIKTAKGFYTYPDPAFLKPEFMEGIR